MKRFAVVNEDRCVSCGACTQVCPHAGVPASGNQYIQWVLCKSGQGALHWLRPLRQDLSCRKHQGGNRWLKKRSIGMIIFGYGR